MVGVELQKYPGGNVTSYKAETSSYKSAVRDNTES